ncbi:kinase/pyrophosphorylase family protein [Neorickettsia helminthoeca str. Oregon]|uniref:Kinase/pyrophosphorylase family protein n=1 Tax=Neorickettsia helminthoeca str. Oregon TaxID=1286528 RepID=X5HJK1_9RICK|nr:pyruvate, water dikinase regulatory protein [Neorickettsia helminthoeca]AHX11269.1 kinase/pyrophosphorylase family protein [Neorickettsia helminthoeca str. Oregon]
MKQLNVHLISDQGVDALLSVSRESLARFKNLEVIESVWPLTDSVEKLQRILTNINGKAFILYAIKDRLIRDTLKEFCQTMRIPCIPILSRIIRELSSYLNQGPTDASKEEYHRFNEDYFARIDAMNYMLSHDDGQNTWDLDEADVIIVGPSRTSKSPTSVYLSYRGYKVANIPFVNNIPLPESLIKLKHVLVIGLTINPDRLIEIRKQRLSLSQNHDNPVYAGREQILDELTNAKRVFMQNNWPIIDVTHRSVEEIAATIIKELTIRQY